ncbi:MAG: NifB/NifX family molybdenum-iron cluster-binding protein [Thermodesulfobacteriota bacterium]
MLAIPVLRCRVAPVLNWCSRIQIFPEDPSQVDGGQELNLPQLEAPQRLQVLREKGVNTLICGALSAELLLHAQELGLTVVSGVAGEVREVVQSYWQNTLDHPRFWLPGCRGPRRYGRGWRGGKKLPCESGSNLRSRGQKRAGGISPLEAGCGPGGFCRCPACGYQVPHEQGIPCVQVVCPHCDQRLERV